MEKDKELTIGFSIIICSYNGADKIIPTLTHLNKLQQNEQFAIEIILVDNNSTDNTAEIARTTWATFQNNTIGFKIIEERKAGKYFAILKAMEIVRYKYFVFCDDDNWLAPDYLEKAYFILKDRPDIGALGGYAEAVFEEEKPELPPCFINNKPMYAIGDQGKNGDVTHRKHLWGAGLISKTQLYQSFYTHYPSFLLSDDNKSGQLVAEDTEYCVRLILKGYKLFYSDTLQIKHFVPNQRLTNTYFDLLQSRIEASFDIIIPYNILTRIYGTLAHKSMNLWRLKMLAPIRLLFSSKKNQIKNQTLYSLFYAGKKDKNKLITKIKQFAEDDFNSD